MSKSIAAVMPLKANSDRVTDKNFRNLGGKPLYRWAMDKLISIKYGCELNVFIYCDDKTWDLIDDDIKSAVKRLYEAEVNSYEDSNGFFQHIAQSLVTPYDGIMYVNATSPFLNLCTYEGCIYKYRADIDCDSVATAIAIYGRLWNSDNQSLNHDPSTCPRTQTQQPIYIESDGLWIVDTDMILKHRRRIGINPYFYPVDQIEAIDINVPGDFDLAEKIAAVTGTYFPA